MSHNPSSLDALVLEAIKSHDLARINDAMTKAAEAATPGWKAFISSKGHLDTTWRDAGLQAADSDKTEVALLLNAWALNEYLRNPRTTESLRSSYAICRSLKGAFGGHCLGLKVWDQETMGLQANSTEQMCADWRDRIRVVRISMDSSTLREPTCQVIEETRGKFSFPSDEDDASDFSVLRARTHKRAYIEVANYSYYDDNNHNYRAHGCLFVAKTQQDMDAWVAERPMIKTQFGFFRSVDLHAVEHTEDWTREQLNQIAPNVMPLRSLRKEVIANDRPMPLRQDKHRPIAMACTIGSIPTVELLLESGARACRVPWDEGALSPMDAAASYGHSDIIKLLATKYGVDVNETDSKGMTPLMRAVQERRIDAVQTLIDLGADLDCVSHDGIALVDRARMQPLVYGRTQQEISASSEEVLAIIQANQARQAIARVRSLGRASTAQAA